MPNLLEYFNNDFKDLSLDTTVNFSIQQLDQDKKVIGQQDVEIRQRIRINMDSSVRLFTYYIPATPDTLSIIGAIIDNLSEQVKQADGVSAFASFYNDVQVGEHGSVYSNRIYFYAETLLSQDEITKLDLFCKERKLFVTVRSSDYLKRKMETEKPVAFISHDSRDKDLIARRLANGLNSRLCFVWYDEYSLKIGDSLRESIEKGIKEAKRCILILTKNYLNNPGWGRKEFNSIFTREMILNERIILPIWHNVSKHEVYDFSPSLADTFALTWPSADNKSDDEYKQEVEQLISKIHAALTT